MNQNTLNASQSESPPQKPNATSPNLEIVSLEVFDRFSELVEIRGEWDQLAIDTNTPIFLSFDWAKIWWDYYGEDSTLRIYVCRKDGVLVGILPVSIASVGIWPVPFRVARVVGASIPPQVIELPVRPLHADAVFELVVEHLIATERCDVLSVGLLVESGPAGTGLKKASKSLSSVVGSSTYLSGDVSTTFHLPESYEEYFASLGKRERKTRRKSLRDLESERSVRVEVIQDSDKIIEEFDRFAEQHTDQWESEGRPGHFGAWPKGLEFHQSLVAAHAAQKRVRLIKMFADDIVAANQYTYTFGDSIFALLPARVTEPDWDRFSLGCCSQLMLIESSIADGYRRIESGLGHYDYKVRLKGVESPVGVLRVVRKGMWTRCKVALYCGVDRVLNLILHRIWYRRIAPRMKRSSHNARPTILLRFNF